MAKAKKVAKKSKSAAKKKSTKDREVLVVASKVKDYIRGQDMQSSSDVVPELSSRIYDILDGAIGRTRENGRATVRPHDL